MLSFHPSLLFVLDASVNMEEINNINILLLYVLMTTWSDRRLTYIRKNSFFGHTDHIRTLTCLFGRARSLHTYTHILPGVDCTSTTLQNDLCCIFIGYHLKNGSVPVTREDVKDYDGKKGNAKT